MLKIAGDVIAGMVVCVEDGLADREGVMSEKQALQQSEKPARSAKDNGKLLE